MAQDLLKLKIVFKVPNEVEEYATKLTLYDFISMLMPGSIILYCLIFILISIYIISFNFRNSEHFLLKTFSFIKQFLFGIKC